MWLWPTKIAVSPYSIVSPSKAGGAGDDEQLVAVDVDLGQLVGDDRVLDRQRMKVVALLRANAFPRASDRRSRSTRIRDLLPCAIDRFIDVDAADAALRRDTDMRLQQPSQAPGTPAPGAVLTVDRGRVCDLLEQAHAAEAGAVPAGEHQMVEDRAVERFGGSARGGASRGGRNRSAGRSPLGWLWARTIPALPCFAASAMMVRSGKSAPVSSPAWRETWRQRAWSSTCATHRLSRSGRIRRSSRRRMPARRPGRRASAGVRHADTAWPDELREPARPRPLGTASETVIHNGANHRLLDGARVAD